ncbi:MAG: hypothetical protein D6727_07990 [Gammaproteobacteria bacterium]|nr:MAG: hypothetical protein D6727_07990 [Gammaproteobacteria bacterium]
MRQLPPYAPYGPRRPGLIAQVLGFIVGAAVLAVSVFLGAFLLAGLLGFALILGLVFYLRLWWLARRLRREGLDEEIIETEYTVIDSRDRDERWP